MRKALGSQSRDRRGNKVVLDASTRSLEISLQYKVDEADEHVKEV